MPAFERSARSAASTPGYWILTATRAAVVQDARGAPGRSTRRRTPRARSLEDVRRRARRTPRRAPCGPSPTASAASRRAQRAELLLVELAVLVREVLGVDEGGELAHLHRGALHRPERVHHPLGGLERQRRPCARADGRASARRRSPSRPRTARPRAPRAGRPAPSGRAGSSGCCGRRRSSDGCGNGHRVQVTLPAFLRARPGTIPRPSLPRAVSTIRRRGTGRDEHF